MNRAIPNAAGRITNDRGQSPSRHKRFHLTGDYPKGGPFYKALYRDGFGKNFARPERGLTKCSVRSGPKQNTTAVSTDIEYWPAMG